MVFVLTLFDLEELKRFKKLMEIQASSINYNIGFFKFGGIPDAQTFYILAWSES